MKTVVIYEVCFWFIVVAPLSSWGFLPPLPRPPIPPHPTLRATPVAPRVAVETRTTTSVRSVDDGNDNTESQIKRFQKLCEMVSPESKTIIKLDQDDNGVRGVYASQPILSGDIIFTIPLQYCFRDDDIPLWMGEEAFDGDDEDENKNTERFTASAWAKRLVGSFLEAQFDVLEGRANEESTQLWLSLLPKPELLKASLPVHWTEDVVESARCTALDLAVDSAYFARAETTSELIQDALPRCQAAQSISPTELHAMVETALDVVQTRTCRVTSPHDGTPLRLLAPVFDMLNHRSQPNAAFTVEPIIVASKEDEYESSSSSDTDNADDDYALVVRAMEPIQKDSEICISYGPAATQPSWRCLASYGFVPSFPPSDDDIDTNNEDNNAVVHSAEVFLEGIRYEVGPDSVPQELVDAMAECMMDPSSSGSLQRPAPFTQQIALRLAQRISEAAFQMLLDDNETTTKEGNDHWDDNVDENWSLSHLISSRQAAALRWNQHRILMSCSLGLRDWAVGQPDSGE